MTHNPTGAGKSSFDLIDSAKLFSFLPLKNGSVLLDVGCGIGNYSIAAAPLVGPDGIIFAVDLWKEGIEQLKQSAESLGFHQIKALLADVGKSIPVPARSVDVCLMATVFHDLVRDGVHDGALKEIQRTLKASGLLAIVEFRKMEGPPGPPKKVRLSEKELETILQPYGFSKSQTADLGTYTYLTLFETTAENE